MSRSMVLVFLLLILIITSQLEWKQQLGNEIEATPSISNRPQQQQQQQQSSSSADREEAIKEKIILSQERTIQRLNELVHNLQQQLQRCRSNNSTRNGAVNRLPEIVNGYERQHLLED